MHEVDDANDESIRAYFEGGVLSAFEGDGRLGNPGDGDLGGGQEGESESVEFTLAMREGGGGGDHFVAQWFIDHVDDELALGANVARGVLGREAVFIAGGKCDDGRVGTEDVEEGEGGRVDTSVGILRGHPCDGSGRDERG